MKKLLLVFSLLFTILSLYPVTAKAQCTLYSVCDLSNGGTNGLVPCGRVELQSAGGTGGEGATYSVVCPCQLEHLGILVSNIFNFLLWQISTPLAGLVVTIGGVMLIVSGGNPGLANQAKNMIKWSLIAIAVMFSSWLITRSILWALGVQSNFIC